MKKRILLLVPDGVGIKNYLYTDVFKDRDAEVLLFHNFDIETLDSIKAHCNFSDTIYIPDYKEGIKEKFLRELIHLSRLKHNAGKLNNPTILSNWKRNHKSFRIKLFYTFIEKAAAFVNSYKAILKLEARYDKAVCDNPFFTKVLDLLAVTKPDLIFCTHQRALKAAAVFAAARKLSINTSTVIYSWDNLPKARMALKADKYFVWSEYMKKEMRIMYPEIPSEKIKVTGTPQFEFFLKPEFIIPKETFYATYKLNPQHKHICFSGDDKTTSPYDPYYLNDLAEALSSGGMQHDHRIIFRRCPVDTSDRYDWVLQKFPDLIVEIAPLWNFNSDKWSAVYPTFEDVNLLTSLAYYADVVINVGSTMALDFGMFGKPCIFINYDHVEDKNWSVNTIYNLQHFRSMPSRDAVYWLNSKFEIAGLVKKALENPTTAINAWFEVVTSSPRSASDIIYKALTS